MLNEQIAANTGFRELSLAEAEDVSGGWNGDEYGILQNSGITVTGIRGGGFNLDGLSFGGFGGFGSIEVGNLGSVGASVSPALADVDWDEFFKKMEEIRQQNEDLDGDGQPGITVTGIRPLPDAFDEMTFDQLVIFNSVWLTYGNQQFADVQAGTNVSGDNPNDIRNADRKAELEAQLLSDAFESLFNEMVRQIP